MLDRDEFVFHLLGLPFGDVESIVKRGGYILAVAVGNFDDTTYRLFRHAVDSRFVNARFRKKLRYKPAVLFDKGKQKVLLVYLSVTVLSCNPLRRIYRLDAFGSHILRVHNITSFLTIFPAYSFSTALHAARSLSSDEK